MLYSYFQITVHTHSIGDTSTVAVCKDRRPLERFMHNEHAARKWTWGSSGAEFVLHSLLDAQDSFFTAYWMHRNRSLQPVGCTGFALHSLLDAQDSFLTACWMHRIRYSQSVGCTGFVLHSLLDAQDSFFTTCWIHGIRSSQPVGCTGFVLHSLFDAQDSFFTACWMHRTAYCVQQRACINGALN
jgi:hypothetical protein